MSHKHFDTMATVWVDNDTGTSVVDPIRSHHWTTHDEVHEEGLRKRRVAQTRQEADVRRYSSLISQREPAAFTPYVPTVNDTMRKDRFQSRDYAGFDASWRGALKDERGRGQLPVIRQQLDDGVLPDKSREVIEAEIKAEEAEAEYQRQLAGEHTAAVKEALKPSASFTIGDLFPA